MADMSSRFPSLFAPVAGRPSGYRAERIAKMIAVLEAGVQAGSIANPVYQEAKEVLGRVIEDAWKAVREPVEPRFSGEKMSEEARDFAWETAFINGGIHGWHKTIQKRLAKAPACPEVAPLVEAMRRFVAEVAPIADAFAYFAADKSRIVKRQPKAEANPRFVAPRASTEASQRLHAMLSALVNEQFEALVAAFVRRYQAELDRFVRLRDAKVAEIAVSEKPNRIYPLSQYLRDQRATGISVDARFLDAVLDESENCRSITPKVKPDADRIIAALARKDAEEVRDAFVAKNLRKIVSIVEAKEKQAALTKCEAVKHSVSLGGLEGTFVVTFADGAGFTFRNAVVFKVSSHGRPFTQFPLTFHDVVLAGGKKMARPSEERMNTVFAKGGEG